MSDAPVRQSLRYDRVTNELIRRTEKLYPLETQVAMLFSILREVHHIEVCEECGGEWFYGKKIHKSEGGEGYSLPNRDSRGVVLDGKAICADCLEAFNLELFEDWEKVQRQVAWWICHNPKLRDRFQKMFFDNDQQYFDMVKRFTR